MAKCIVWTVDKNKLASLVRSSSSFADILRSLNLKTRGGQMQILKRKLEMEGIDFSHIPQGRGSNKNRKFGKSPLLIPLKDILIDGCKYNRYHLKKRLIGENLLSNKCAICGQLPEWNNKCLVLVLDHINGKNDDNSIENLRLLCPNCNSQTETFSGRNRKI